MSKYPEIVEQLVSAAYDQGMSKQTQVYAVADGAMVTRSAASKVSNLTFIPDRPHLKQHLPRAEAIDLQARSASVGEWQASPLPLGKLKVIKTLKGYQSRAELIYFSISSDLEMLSIMTTPYSRLPISLRGCAITLYSPKRLKIPGAIWHPDTVNHASFYELFANG